MTSEPDLGQIAVAHRRLERWMMAFMVIGLLALFQPWFRSIAGLFDGLADSGDAARVYREDIAPNVFRYGFYLLLASTLGFIIVGHYTPPMLQRAFIEKGKAFTYWLILLPLGYGLMVISNLAYGYAFGSVLALVGAVAAIAAWNWRAWGVIAIALIGILYLVALISGAVTWLGAVLVVVFAVITVALAAPHRDRFRRKGVAA